MWHLRIRGEKGEVVCAYAIPDGSDAFHWTPGIPGYGVPMIVTSVELVNRPLTFDEAWAAMIAKGYQYGPDALEQVRLGWELARGKHI